MTLKQNTDFKKRFDEYIEKHSRKTEKNKIKTFMKQIRHGLARGADKKTIFNFFRDEKILTLSYNSFCRYLTKMLCRTCQDSGFSVQCVMYTRKRGVLWKIVCYIGSETESGLS